MEVRLVDRARRVGAAEISDATPWRTLAYRKLEEDSDTPKKAIEKHGIYLMTVPPVTPTTKGTPSSFAYSPDSGDFGHASNEIHSLSPVGRLLESPSTATLRFRRQPFLKIEYAIQLSLGPFLLLEIPIDIGEHSTRDKSITLEVRSSSSSPYRLPPLAFCLWSTANRRARRGGQDPHRRPLHLHSRLPVQGECHREDGQRS